MANSKYIYIQDIEALNTQIRNQSKELKSDLFLLFSRTADVFNRYLDYELNKRNSNKTLFGILHNLITHGGNMTPTDLAEKVFRSKHAITRAVDILEKEGLVKRGLIKGDRRLTKVSITPRGLDLVSSRLKGRREIIHRSMSCLSNKQSEELKVILTILKDHLLELLKIDNGYIRKGLMK